MNVQTVSALSGNTESQLLDKLLEVIDALVLVCSADGTIHRFNKKCEEITGYSAAEMLGSSVWDLIPPDELDGVVGLVNQVYAGDFPNSYVNHWLVRNGPPALIAWSNNALLDERGRVSLIVATGIDISDQTRMEASFRAAIDSFEDGFSLYDSNERLVAVNGAYWNFFGNLREHIQIGMTFREVSQVVYSQTNLHERYDTFEEFWHERWHLRDRPGQSFLREYAPGRFSKARTYSTSDNGIALFLTDVTKEIRSERTFKALVETSNEPGYSLRERITRMLDIGRAHFGMEVGLQTRVAGNMATIEALSSEDELFQVGAEMPFPMSYSRYIVGQSGVVAYEDIENSDLRNGEPFARKPLYSIIGAPVMVGGAVYGALYFASNQAAARAFTDEDSQIVSLLTNSVGMQIHLNNVISELDKFAYIASHDLKAPLRAIDNLTQWIEEDAGDKLEGDVRSFLSLLRGRAARLENLLNDLLEFSRAGRMAGRQKQLNSGQVLSEAIELIAPPDHIDIVVTGDMPDIFADPVSLTQIFANLLSNAIKHHDKKNGKIEISVAELGDYWEFCFEDDGPGIPQEFRERVFEVFQTLKPRDEIEGSGMGLAIVKKLIDAAGGRINVSDRKDRQQGAAFNFTWPKTHDKAVKV